MTEASARSKDRPDDGHTVSKEVSVHVLNLKSQLSPKEIDKKDADLHYV